MAENTVVTSVEGGECKQVYWIFKNWSTTHEIAIATTCCYVEFGEPKVKVRFFLRPFEKFVTCNNVTYELNWYSLWAEVLTPLQNSAIKVTCKVINQTIKAGTNVLNMSKGRVVEVIREFLHMGTYTNRVDGQERALSSNGLATTSIDLTLPISVQLFRITETGNTVAPSDANDAESLHVEAEESLTRDLRNMFAEAENLADVKLETMDHMTLDAHKFILSARSQYLRKSIQDAMKKENFNGTVNIDINGKPLVAILHWIYTGELHENADKVMEEVVDAAILFQLNHLMKILDKQLVTICNKENMFRLYQVAQKNGMPTAMDDISVYIRENL